MALDDGWSLALLRRAFAMSSIVLGAYNTLSSIQSAVYIMSVTRPWPGALVEAQLMEVRTYSDEETAQDQVGHAYWSCDDENGQEIYPHAIVNCPVTFSNNTPYLVFILLWSSYFVILFLYHFYHCMQYKVTDLRYFINLLNAENNRIHKGYIIFGMILTVCSFVYAFHRSITNPASSKADTAQTQILFLFFNIFILKQFLVDNTNSVTVVCMETDFPDPIPLHHVPDERHCGLFNLYGRIISVDSLFENLLRTVAVHHLLGQNDNADDEADSRDVKDTDGVARALRILYSGREVSLGVTATFRASSSSPKAAMLPRLSSSEGQGLDADLKTELLNPASTGSL